MIKKLFSLFFSIIIICLMFLPAVSASAYEVTEFEIHAKAGALISLDTGEFLYENNIDQRLYPASITKIMTATVMLESKKFNPDEKIAMTASALKLVLGTGSVVSNLRAGEEITQKDLLYYLLMSSAGDCAYLVAEYYGGSVENFVKLMNKKAAELGLTSTCYENPVGLHHESNYTTVRDIYTLASYAMQNELFMEVCSSDRYTVPATNFSGERTLTTTNRLQDKNTNYFYKYAHGIKTGFTDEAGRCLVSTASYDGYNYMCILMGCPNNANKRYEFYDSAELYRWAFNNFAFKKIADSDEPVCEMPIELSLETDYVSLYFKEPFVTILPKEADDSTIVVKTTLNEKSHKAPVKKGQVLGYAEIYYAEKLIGTVDLVAGETIKPSGILVFAHHAKSFFTSTFMKVIIIAIILIVVIFIILCIRLNISKLKKRKVKYIPYNHKEKGENTHEK